MAFGSAATTRSYLDATGRGTIKRLDVLVFQKVAEGYLLESKMTVTDFGESGTTWEDIDANWQADPIKSFGDGHCVMRVTPGKKRFYFFANCDKATLKRYSDKSTFSFDDISSIRNEEDLKDIVIEKFSYSNPQYDETDLLPMTGVLDYEVTEDEHQTVTSPAQIELTRAVSKVTVKARLDVTGYYKSSTKTTYLPSDSQAKSGEVTYVSLQTFSISNNPTYSYLYPQYTGETSQVYATDDGTTKEVVKLPSYESSDYQTAGMNTLDKAIEFTSTNTNYTTTEEVTETSGTTTTTSTHYFTAYRDLGSVYVLENPFGTGSTTGGKRLNDQTAGVYKNMGSASRLTISYTNKKKSGSSLTTQTNSVLRDIPYLERNGELQILATILLPSTTYNPETFDVYIQVQSTWTPREEDVPAFE